MSNEELATLIQMGDTERIPELWEQVQDLVKWKANRTMTALELRGNPCGVTFDDLYQSGYIAMVEAVHFYTPENGVAFSTCLVNQLKTVFAEATGYRTKSGRNEPLNNCFSLDKTVDGESDGNTFGDLAPDPAATAQFQSVEEKLWHKQMQKAMEAALLALPDNQRQVLQMLYWQEKTLQEAAEVYGVSYERIRQIEAKALRVLRQPKNACKAMAKSCGSNVYALTKKWFLGTFATEEEPFDMAEAREAINAYRILKAVEKAAESSNPPAQQEEKDVW